jgi:hypothetical protein
MKVIFRFGLVLMVVALLMAALPAIPTHAQGVDRMCFDLQAADCDFLYSAMSPEAIAQYKTGTTLSYTLTARSNGAEPGSLTLSGTAAGGGTSDNPILSVDFNADTESNGDKSNFPLQLRILNKRIYFNTLMFTEGKWKYLPLEQAQSSIPSEESLGDQIKGLSELAGGDSDTSDAAMSAASDPEVQAAFSKAIVSPGVVTSSITDAKSTDGIDVKQFQFVFDPVKMVQAPEFRPAVEKMVASNPDAGLDTDSVIARLSDALKNTSVQLGFQVGATDKLLHGIAFHAVSKIDAATLQSLQALSGDAEDAEPVEGDLDGEVLFRLSLTNIGTAPIVEEPADAEEFDMSSLFGGFGGLDMNSDSSSDSTNP